jgi:hypothetical protein
MEKKFLEATVVAKAALQSLYQHRAGLDVESTSASLKKAAELHETASKVSTPARACCFFYKLCKLSPSR